jgi:hypothetical protein
MAKLTDTQLIVMSRAAQREDGAAIVPERLNRSAAMKIATSLIGRGLMQEVAGAPGMPVWRRDAEDRPVSLVITTEGRRAIGLGEDEPSCDVTPHEEPVESTTGNEAAFAAGKPDKMLVRKKQTRATAEEGSTPDTCASDAANGTAAEHDDCAPSQNAIQLDVPSAEATTNQTLSALRRGSKQALLVGLLSRPQGATIAELTKATGWLPHTTRAALTRLRQSGYPVDSLRAKGESTLYRIVQDDGAEG